jgi:hypothetical protein
MEGHIASRTCLSSHFKEAASPFECRAWLVPVIIDQHWYLLAFDWMYNELRIYDSLATGKMPHPRLVEFGTALLDLVNDDFNLGVEAFNMVPEQVSGFHCSLTRF